MPILLSLSQMKYLGTTIELDPKGDKITCPIFGLYSSPADYSKMGHIVLDLTNLAYQSTTKSREQPGHPKRHVTFAMSEQKQHIQLMHQTCMTMKMRMTNHLCVQHQGRNLMTQLLMTKIFFPWFLQVFLQLSRTTVANERGELIVQCLHADDDDDEKTYCLTSIDKTVGKVRSLAADTKSRNSSKRAIEATKEVAAQKTNQHVQRSSEGW